MLWEWWLVKWDCVGRGEMGIEGDGPRKPVTRVPTVAAMMKDGRIDEEVNMAAVGFWVKLA